MQEPYSVGVQGTSAGHEVDLGASVEQAASGASALDQAPPVSPANESPSATPSSASMPPTRSPARDSDAGTRTTSVPAAPAVGDTSGAATTILTGSSAAVTGSPSEAVHSPRRVTRLQHGIRKPKSYTDGTIRYGCFAESSEPSNLDEALQHKHWKHAMDEEYDALMRNKTWRLVPVAEPPKLSRLKCAGHHHKGDISSNALQTEQFLVCRVTSRYNHRISDRTSIPRTKASPEILQPQILQHMQVQ